jgi:chitodextrinase
MKKVNIKTKKLTLKRKKQTSLAIAILVILVAAIPLTNYLIGSHAASSTSLYLSPTTQSVMTGNNIVVSIIIDPAGASVNTVQSVFTYNPTNFTLVSVVQGTAFGQFPNTTTNGTITFAAANTTPITTTQTVATVTLKATGLGGSALTLASVCPSGNYAVTCSAAYDSVTSFNDLGSVVNANYTVSPVIPSTPVLSSTGSTLSSINLSWTPSTDINGPGIAGYNIYLNGSTVPIATTTGTTYNATGLTSKTKYSYTVVAYDTGSPLQQSLLSNVVTVTTPSPIPLSPTGLITTSSTYNSISLSWNTSTDPGGTLAGYAIYENGSSTPIGTTSGNAYSVSGLSPYTAYNFTVAAYDNSTIPIYSPISTPALSATTLKIGDVDGDGLVTGHDLSLMLSNYGKSYPAAEFDGTSSVEGHDLSLLLANYGK